MRPKSFQAFFLKLADHATRQSLRGRTTKLSAFLNKLSAFLTPVRRSNGHDAVCNMHTTAEWVFAFAPPKHDLLILVLLLAHSSVPGALGLCAHHSPINKLKIGC